MSIEQRFGSNQTGFEVSTDMELDDGYVKVPLAMIGIGAVLTGTGRLGGSIMKGCLPDGVGRSLELVGKGMIGGGALVLSFTGLAWLVSKGASDLRAIKKVDDLDS